MEKLMTEQDYKKFYDKVGKLNGWDFSKINYTTIDNSEFKYFNELNRVCNDKTLLLDVGTGGGEKILSRLKTAGYIIGIDHSKSMIETAQINLQKHPTKRAKFLLMEGDKLQFPDELFDVICARHSHCNGQEYFRCLKKGGTYISEDISWNDCAELENMFTRIKTNSSKPKLADMCLKDLKQGGFKDVKFYEINQTEFYKTTDDLLFLLCNTPILPNFPKEKNDMENFLNYVSKYSTKKGIKLERRLFGIIATKDA